MGDDEQPGRPKIEELKTICFKCKNAVVVDCHQTIERPVPHPIVPNKMAVERAEVFFFQAYCHAEGLSVAINPQCDILKCTHFEAIESGLHFKKPKEPEQAKSEESATESVM
jgi:hypothetical protein